MDTKESPLSKSWEYLTLDGKFRSIPWEEVDNAINQEWSKYKATHDLSVKSDTDGIYNMSIRAIHSMGIQSRFFYHKGMGRNSFPHFEVFVQRFEEVRRRDIG